MSGLPKPGHHAKGAERRKVVCEDCHEEREIIISPKRPAPSRCQKCSRRRAGEIWNGRRKAYDP